MKLKRFAYLLFASLGMTLTACPITPFHPGGDGKVTQVVLSSHNERLHVGDTKELTAIISPDNAKNKDVIWYSNNSNIATVNNNGIVTGASVGETKINVKTVDRNYTDFCTFTIVDANAVMSISLNLYTKKINVGDEFTLVATVEPSTATNRQVIWSTSDSNVASVSNSGTVKGITSGKASITATTVDGGLTAVCAVTVNENKPHELWDESQNNLRTGSKNLDFYSLNDFHGATEDNGSSEPGINYLSSYIKSLKSLNSDGFVLTSSGDMWQGSADSNITRGALVDDWMNHLGVSAMALGNHEFDWTINQITKNMEDCNFPILACNIVNTLENNTVDWIEPYTTITRNGVHIGIIGAIGEGITSSILATNVKNLSFVDPNPYIMSWSQYLRENGADVILVIYHGTVFGIDAQTGNEVNAIFGGHTHSLQKTMIGSSPAIQAKANGSHVGHIGLSYDFTTKSSSVNTYEYLQTYSASHSLGIDADTKAIYDTYLSTTISDVKGEVVSQYSGGISKGNIPIIYNNYAYKYFKDVHDTSNKIEISFVWTNQARDAIPAHKITYGDLYKALPFDNSLCLMKMKGSSLRKIVDQNYGYKFIPNVGFASTQDIDSLCSDNNKEYYFLVIDYIISFENYTTYVTPDTYVETFLEEDAMPRNIVKRYISGYPDNIIN